MLHRMPLDQSLMNLLLSINVHLPVMASCLEGKKPMLDVAEPSAEGLSLWWPLGAAGAVDV